MVDTALTTNPAPKLTGVVAVMIVIGFFVVLGVLIYQDKNPDMMIGALIGAFTGIMGFLYGTTTGSARKDAAIQQLTQTAAIVATTAQSTQTAADVAAAGGSPLASPVQAEDVQIDAERVTVDSNQKGP